MPDWACRAASCNTPGQTGPPLAPADQAAESRAGGRHQSPASRPRGRPPPGSRSSADAAPDLHPATEHAPDHADPAARSPPDPVADPRSPAATRPTNFPRPVAPAGTSLSPETEAFRRRIGLEWLETAPEQSIRSTWTSVGQTKNRAEGWPLDRSGTHSESESLRLKTYDPFFRRWQRLGRIGNPFSTAGDWVYWTFAIRLDRVGSGHPSGSGRLALAGCQQPA